MAPPETPGQPCLTYLWIHLGREAPAGGTGTEHCSFVEALCHPSPVQCNSVYGQNTCILSLPLLTNSSQRKQGSAFGQQTIGTPEAVDGLVPQLALRQALEGAEGVGGPCDIVIKEFSIRVSLEGPACE